MGSVRLTGESDIDCSFCFFARTSTYKRRQNGKDLSVFFDGTTRLGEAMDIVVRFIDSDWQIQQ